MENKMFKKLAAAGAAIMMAVTGMAVNASANSWSLYYSKTGVCKTYDYENFAAPANSQLNHFYDSCSSYIQTTNGSGQVAYVTYRAGCLDLNGNIDFFCCSQKYYYGTQSNHNVPLSTNVPANRVMRVMHTLNGNNNNCSFSGNVSD